MPLDQKGRNILKATNYEKVRRGIAKAVAEYIKDRASTGEDLQSIVEKVLQEENFREFFQDLVRRTQQVTKLSEGDSKNCAYMLVSEETGRELKRVVPHLIAEQGGKPAERRRKLHEKLRSRGVVKGSYVGQAVVCGRKGVGTVLGDLLREHPILLRIILAGVAFISLAVLLIGSVYETLLAALTLQPSSATTVWGKLGNILAALGGVLLFFTSVSLIVSHILDQDRKRRMVYRLAEEYLHKSS